MRGECIHEPETYSLRMVRAPTPEGLDIRCDAASLRAHPRRYSTSNTIRDHDTMSRFVTHIEAAYLPKLDGGRTIRVVFDLDVTAIHDYIMFDAKDSADPWPVGVMRELMDTLMEEFRDIEASRISLTSSI